MKKFLLALSATVLLASASSAFACKPGCVCLPHHRHHHRKAAQYVWVPVAVVTVQPVRVMTLAPPPLAYAPGPGFTTQDYNNYGRNYSLERRGGYSNW